MTDVNLTGLAALSECSGFDLTSHAFVAIEELKSGQERELVIDCWSRAIALSLKRRFVEDSGFAVAFLEIVKEYWGVENLFLKATGKSVYLTSLGAERRVQALIDSGFRLDRPLN